MFAVAPHDMGAVALPVQRPVAQREVVAVPVVKQLAQREAGAGQLSEEVVQHQRRVVGREDVFQGRGGEVVFSAGELPSRKTRPPGWIIWAKRSRTRSYRGRCSIMPIMTIASKRRPGAYSSTSAKTSSQAWPSRAASAAK